MVAKIVTLYTFPIDKMTKTVHNVVKKVEGGSTLPKQVRSFVVPAELIKIHPTGKLSLIWLDPGVQSTKGGIVIPAQYQQITQHGLVVAVGPQVPVDYFGPGDRVLIDLNSGTKVTDLKNTPVLLVDLDHVQGLVEGAIDDE